MDCSVNGQCPMLNDQGKPQAVRMTHGYRQLGELRTCRLDGAGIKDKANMPIISATKTEGGSLTIAFPDVCVCPAPPGGAVPIPYPSIAKTAVAQQTQVAQKVPVAPSPGASAAGTQTEIQQLRGRLSSVHQQMLGLHGSRPEQWQALLKDYAVTASALYRTLEVIVQLESRRASSISSILQ